MLHAGWLRRSGTLATLLLVLAACFRPRPRLPRRRVPPRRPPPPTSPPPARAAASGPWRTSTGKTVSFLVGTGPGGVYDTWSRLVGRYLGKYVPGNPNVIVENRSAAGGLVALNHLTNVAPKDGTVLAAFPETDHLVGADERAGGGVRLPSASLDRQPVAGLRRLYRRLADGRDEHARPDRQRPAVVFGGTTPDGRMGYEPMLLNQALGTNFKVVFGYDGAPKVRLGMESGELDGSCWNWDSDQHHAGLVHGG